MSYLLCHSREIPPPLPYVSHNVETPQYGMHKALRQAGFTVDHATLDTYSHLETSLTRPGTRDKGFTTALWICTRHLVQYYELNSLYGYRSRDIYLRLSGGK